MFRIMLVLVLLFSCGPAHADGSRVIAIKQGSFEDVKDAVETAIIDRGFIVNNVAHIGDMLSRTGKDLGYAKDIYIKAEALEFCSAVVSRKMMEADPDNIVFCPYVIAIYVLPKKPGEVRIAYRLHDSKRPELDAVDKLLSDIVKDALAAP